MIDLDEPKFLLSEVADAAGVNLGTLRNWFQRGHFSLGETDKAAPAGASRLLTQRRALHIGAAVELIRQGMDPAKASRAALAFSDLGNTDPQRGPGELFIGSQVWTVLVAHAGVNDGIVYRIDRSTPMERIFFPHGADAAFAGSRQVGATVILLNVLVARLERCLTGQPS